VRKNAGGGKNSRPKRNTTGKSACVKGRPHGGGVVFMPRRRQRPDVVRERRFLQKKRIQGTWKKKGKASKKKNPTARQRRRQRFPASPCHRHWKGKRGGGKPPTFRGPFFPVCTGILGRGQNRSETSDAVLGSGGTCSGSGASGYSNTTPSCGASGSGKHGRLQEKVRVGAKGKAVVGGGKKGAGQPKKKKKPTKGMNNRPSAGQRFSNAFRGGGGGKPKGGIKVTTKKVFQNTEQENACRWKRRTSRPAVNILKTGKSRGNQKGELAGGKGQQNKYSTPRH